MACSKVGSKPLCCLSILKQRWRKICGNAGDFSIVLMVFSAVVYAWRMLAARSA